jgi:tRNA-Thr(GGU) m(6)t(6)A37 methyltransferase TsaA
MNASDASMSIRPVARVVSPYREKFGVPRQPGLVPAARGYLEMLPEYAAVEAFEGIEGFSHLWVIFGFHLSDGQPRLRVRPPRLGGNEELGVFATRSPFRPNGLGLSVLRFQGLETAEGRLRVAVSGLDMVDGTPVYDIKPYVPYTDALPAARGGFAAEPPAAGLQVSFSQEAEAQLSGLGETAPGIRRLIEQSLALDPRPAYQRGDGRIYGTRLSAYDVRWRVEAGRVIVERLVCVE